MDNDLTVCDNCHLTGNSNAVICLLIYHAIIVTATIYTYCMCMYMSSCVCMYLCVQVTRTITDTMTDSSMTIV